MLILRSLAIVIAGAGVFASLPLTNARACDDDRYPCPVRSEALTQETDDVPTQPAPPAQPQKKMNDAARPNEKAHAKREREVPRATVRAKVSTPAVQKQATEAISRATEAAKENAVQFVDPNELNELDRAALFQSAPSSKSTPAREQVVK
jgi:hypothetical protein